MKKIALFSTVIVLILAGAYIIKASSGSSAEVDECVTAWENRASSPGGTSSIENPYDSERYLICKGNTKQDVVYQALVDLKFSEIDSNIKTDLESLSKMKKTETADILKNYIEGWFDNSSKDRKYPKKYEEVCSSGVINETISYLGGSISTEGNTKFYLQGQTKCMELAEKKIAAYKDIAWLIVGRDKVKQYKDDKNTMMKSLKKKYRDFLNKVNSLVGQTARVKDIWPSKTKKLNENTY